MPKPKVKAYLKSYLDLEAVVDEDEDGDMDEEMEKELDQFLDGAEVSGDEEIKTPHRPFPAQELGDAEAIADSVERRYASQLNEELAISTQTAGNSNCHLFKLPVKVGQEKDAVTAIQDYISMRRNRQQTTTIHSIQFFKQFPEQVFVWAEGPGELRELASSYTYMFHTRIIHIDHEEWLRLYAAIDDAFRIAVPS